MSGISLPAATIFGIPEADGTLFRIDGITGIPLSFPVTLPEGNSLLVEVVLTSSWRFRLAGPESNFLFFSS